VGHCAGDEAAGECTRTLIPVRIEAHPRCTGGNPQSVAPCPLPGFTSPNKSEPEPMLMGEMPFSGSRSEPLEQARAICEQEPERPSNVCLRTHHLPARDARRMRGDLDSIVRKTLNKEPDHRLEWRVHISSGNDVLNPVSPRAPLQMGRASHPARNPQTRSKELTKFSGLCILLP
jgi:hypothetical protein